jgi:hypothetical protein
MFGSFKEKPEKRQEALNDQKKSRGMASPVRKP